MNKIIIIGSPGSGKTTLSNYLSKNLNIPVHHLDDWQTLSPEDFKGKQEELMKGDKWILDGNFVKTIDNRIRKADTVIFLDLYKFIICWRFIKRSLTDFNHERREIGKNNYLKAKWGVFKYIWAFPSAKIHQIIEKSITGQRVLILRSPADIRRLRQQCVYK